MRLLRRHSVAAVGCKTKNSFQLNVACPCSAVKNTWACSAQQACCDDAVTWAASSATPGPMQDKPKDSWQGRHVTCWYPFLARGRGITQAADTNCVRVSGQVCVHNFVRVTWHNGLSPADSSAMSGTALLPEPIPLASRHALHRAACTCRNCNVCPYLTMTLWNPCSAVIQPGPIAAALCCQPAPHSARGSLRAAAAAAGVTARGDAAPAAVGGRWVASIAAAAAVLAVCKEAVTCKRNAVTALVLVQSVGLISFCTTCALWSVWLFCIRVNRSSTCSRLVQASSWLCCSVGAHVMIGKECISAPLLSLCIFPCLFFDYYTLWCLPDGVLGPAFALPLPHTAGVHKSRAITAKVGMAAGEAQDAECAVCR